MARRTRAQDKLIGFLVLIAIVIWVAKAAFDLAMLQSPTFYFGLGALAGAVVLIRAGLRWNRRRREVAANELAFQQRRAELVQRYSDPSVIDQILQGSLWHDMTKQQLIDAWGHPDDVETKVMKTKVREIYKFGRIGVNQFRRRAVLENDCVVGWEEK